MECGCDKARNPSTSIPEWQVLSVSSTVFPKPHRTNLQDQSKEPPHHTTTKQQMVEMTTHPRSSSQPALKMPRLPSRRPSDDLPDPKARFGVSSQRSKQVRRHRRSESGIFSVERRRESNLGNQNNDDEILRAPKSSMIPNLTELSHDGTASATNLTRFTPLKTTMPNSGAGDIARRANALPPTALSIPLARRSATSQESRPTGTRGSTGASPTYRDDGRKGRSWCQFCALPHQCLPHQCQRSPHQRCREADRRLSRRAPDGQVASGLRGHRRSVDAVEESSLALKLLQVGPCPNNERHSTPQPTIGPLYIAESLPSEQESNQSGHLNDQGMPSTQLTPLRIPSTSRFQQISSQDTTHGTVCTGSLQTLCARPDSMLASTTCPLREQIIPVVSAARTSEESDDSPASSIFSHPDWHSSEGSYDTPLTSQCSSPVKGPPLPGLIRRLTSRFSALCVDHAQFNGPADHESESATEEVLRDEHGENCFDPGSQQLAELHTSHLGVDLTNPFGVHNDASQLADPLKDATSLVQACSAKRPPTASCFAETGNPITPQSSQRYPSKFLGYCERSSSHRQRRSMAETLETPDRFIPGRRETPTKEALLLRRPAKRSSIHASHRYPASAPTTDPFASAQTR
ncbi:hypothetical protein DOTSEDRAFT_49294, partial [Dothistroma septosporum NZE10]